MKARLCLEVAPTQEEDGGGARPAPTKVLGAQQARKRLHAFSSLLKQSALLGSPKKAGVEKKPATSVKKDDGKKSKTTVIEEIEQLKKQEHDYLMSLKEKVQAKMVMNETRKDKKISRDHDSKEKRRERKKSRSPSPVKQKYPENWSELLEMRLELSDLKTIKSGKTKNGCIDYRKHLSFEKHSAPISALRITRNNGQEMFVPPFLVRYTKKEPSISYSTNNKFFLARKEIFAEMPRSLRYNCQKIIDGSKNVEEEKVSQTKTRFWYPENIFGPIVQQQQQQQQQKEMTECEILEPSICLSFLKNYSDIEDDVADDEKVEIEKQKTETDVADTADKKKEKKARKKKKRKKKKKEEADISGKTKEKKRKHRKKKTDDKIKRTELKKTEENEAESHSPPLENKFEKLNQESGVALMENNELKIEKDLLALQKVMDEEWKKEQDSPRQHKLDKKIKEKCFSLDKKEKNSHSPHYPFDSTEFIKKTERSSPFHDKLDHVENEESLTPETKPKINERTHWKQKSESKRNDTRKPNMQRQKNKNKSTVDGIKKTVKESHDDDLPLILNENATTSTPDTDEYHSLWESDEEAAVSVTNIKKEQRLFNNSWESDEEQQFERNRRRSPERCLEMPLNIKTFSRRDHPPPIKFSLFSEDSWEKETIGSDEVRRLEEERRTISEERRLLQLERKKLEELERKRYFTNITQEKLIVEKERSASPFYKKTIEMEVEEPLFKRNRDHVTYSRKEKKPTKWNDVADTKKRKNDTSLVADTVKKEKIELPSPQVKQLENEYEEFMKAVTSETPIQQKLKKQSPSASSSSSSSSSASSTSSSSSSSSSESSAEETAGSAKKKRRKKVRKGKSENFDEFVLEPKQATDDFNLLPKVVQTSPKPVPTPTATEKETWQHRLADSTSSPTKKPVHTPDLLQECNWSLDSQEEIHDTNRKQTPVVAPFNFSSITLTSKKRTTLIKPAFKLNDDESEAEEKTPLKVRKEPERVRSRSPQHRRRMLTPPRSRRRGGSPLSRRQRRRSLSPPRRITRRGRRTPSPPTRRRRRRSHSVSPPPRRRTRSPVEVLKRSVADSTISDDQLPQYSSTNEVSPMLDFNLGGSPKRVPLDVRINQVLGLEKQAPPSLPPPPPPPRPNYYNYQQYKPPKVVQVGNMIQIVPTEECLTIPYTQQQQQTQQIVQVGNMLQIVPSEIPPPEPLEQPPPIAIVEDPIQKEKQQKAQERERKRKEKERKRKEREKKKQQKLKMRTERMIKRALLLEIEEENGGLGGGGGGGGEDIENQENVNGPWPPVPVVLNNQALKPAGKGILLSRGCLSKLNVEEGETTNSNNINNNNNSKKSVKFADGISPGEGTSPSAGEELSSPPPPSLSKEKRYKKTRMLKKSKKKKVKVKVIRKSEILTTPAPLLSVDDDDDEDDDDDDDDEDYLPPPPPPPGSPPPHIFPPRVKVHTINNVHPSNFLQQQQPVYRQQPLTFNMPPPPPHHPPPGIVHHASGVIHSGRPPPPPPF